MSQPSETEPPSHGAAMRPDDAGARAAAQPSRFDLETFFQMSADLLAVAGLDGFYKRVNPSFMRLLGFSEQELLGRPFIDFIHPEDRPSAMESMQRLLAGEPVLNFEDRNICKDGSYRWISWMVTPRLDLGLVYGVGRDITLRRQAEARLEQTRDELEHRVVERTASLEAINQRLVRENAERCQAEAALRASEERFRTLAEAMDDVVWTAEVQGGGTNLKDARTLYVNPAVKQVTGIPAGDFIQRTDRWMNLVHPEDRPRLEAEFERLGREGHFQCEYRIVRETGEFRWVLGRTWLVGRDEHGVLRTGGLVSDITDRKRIEEALREKDRQIRQVQKLEAVGLLAGGVAHEYNNILQVIRGYTHFALQDVAPGSSTDRHLQRVMLAVDRAATLTLQLLSFSRQQAISQSYIDPNKLVNDHLKMLRPLIGEPVQVVVKLQTGIGTIYADGGLLQQVLLNLCLNARDAMPEGGTLTLATRAVTIPEDGLSHHLELRPGRHLCLTVSDTGQGMSEEVKRHIFEPFFTTKEVGQGTGLGLATVYGIVKQHEGAIEVISTPGQGSTFEVYLPIHERLADTQPRTAARPPGHGHEGVLVAEDEPMLLDLAVLALQEAGYTFFTARDGLEAIRVFSQHADEIQILVLDVMMPKLSGRSVYQQIRAIRPEIKAIFCTGHDPKNNEVVLLLHEGLPLLRKPFAPADLLAAMRDVLDKKPGDEGREPGSGQSGA